jgi:hypothetical protein
MLMCAAELGFVEVADLLLDNGAASKRRNKENGLFTLGHLPTLLVYAVVVGYRSEPLSCHSEEGGMECMLCPLHGRFKSRVCLAVPADVIDEEGRTALSHDPLTRLLLRNGLLCMLPSHKGECVSVQPT